MKTQSTSEAVATGHTHAHSSIGRGSPDYREPERPVVEPTACGAPKRFLVSPKMSAEELRSTMSRLVSQEWAKRTVDGATEMRVESRPLPPTFGQLSSGSWCTPIPAPQGRWNAAPKNGPAAEATSWVTTVCECVGWANPALEAEFEHLLELSARLATSFWGDGRNMSRVMWAQLSLILEEQTEDFEPSIWRTLVDAARRHLTY